MIKCLSCGKRADISDANYCPYCSKSLKMQKNTPFPIVAGAFTTLASCMTLVIGIFFIAGALFSSVFAYEFGTVWISNYPINVYLLVAGILEIIAFAFGLTGSIYSLKRRRLALSIFGMSLLLASGAMIALPMLIYGLPIAILSILSVIFVAISKSEFH